MIAVRRGRAVSLGLWVGGVIPATPGMFQLAFA